MNTVLSLKEQYETIRTSNPRLRIRDIAKEIQVSEADLVAMRTGDGVVRLDGDFKALIAEIHTIGYVMALTRNDHAVHERKGVYNNVSFTGEVGLVLDEDIDLRLFAMHWKFGFAVLEGDRRSIQLFDRSGEAVHKIYLTDSSDVAAYEALVARYTAAEQLTELHTEAYPAADPEKSDTEIDVEGFRQAWLGMKDTHEFFGVTRSFGVSRKQALRLAPEGMAQPVPVATARKMLELASERQVPIMVFVANRGCIQIHTGTVSNLMATGLWFNVLDPEFNLHLRESAIDTAYIVRKPSDDGIVTSLEVFDAAGNMIAQFFGKRKPGIPELNTWRTLVADLIA